MRWIIALIALVFAFGLYLTINRSPNVDALSEFLSKYGLPAPAYAADANLTWTPPTLNADGSPLTDLAGYTLSRGNVSGGPYNHPQQDIPAPANSFLDLGLASETTYCWILQSYDDNGNLSAPSNEACLTTGDTLSPAAPGNLQAVEQ